MLDFLRTGRSLSWLGTSFGYPDVQQLADAQAPARRCSCRAPCAGTPAARAGLGDDGELLAAVDGQPLEANLSSWCRATRGMRSGQTLQLDVVGRKGQRRTAEVRLA